MGRSATRTKGKGLANACKIEDSVVALVAGDRWRRPPSGHRNASTIGRRRCKLVGTPGMGPTAPPHELRYAASLAARLCCAFCDHDLRGLRRRAAVRFPVHDRLAAEGRHGGRAMDDVAAPEEQRLLRISSSTGPNSNMGSRISCKRHSISTTTGRRRFTTVRSA